MGEGDEDELRLLTFGYAVSVSSCHDGWLLDGGLIVVGKCHPDSELL